MLIPFWGLTKSKMQPFTTLDMMKNISLYINRFCVLGIICMMIVVSVPLSAQNKRDSKPKTGNKTNESNMVKRPIDVYKVGLLVKAFGDSIVIRWAPDKPDLFRAALKSGYLLTRNTINDDNSQTIDYQVLVKPWTVDIWLTNTTKNDTLAAACAQLVNGKNTPLKSDETLTLDKIMQQQNQSDLRMTMAMILADVKPFYAMGMALGFVDKKVQKGKHYAYFLKPLVDPDRYDVDLASTSVRNIPDPEIQSMVPIKTVSGEHNISLIWERDMAEAQFTSYYVERSEDGGKTFKRVNRIPWLQPMDVEHSPLITFGDSVKQNYRPYQYRVLGLTPFGETVASDVVTAQAVDKTAPLPATHAKTKYLENSTVKVTWQYDNPPADLAGFIVGKSKTINGEYTPINYQIISPNTREIIDSNVIEKVSTYYKIVALDTARNLSMGLPILCEIKDRKGPSKPQNVQGYIDSTGLIRMVWDANPESNIYGYKVLSANSPEHTFILETKGFLAIPAFSDSTSLRTLSRKKYFKVIAYDKNYRPSEPSEILTLTRPDIVAPIAPVIKKYMVADTSVALSWELSPSTDVKEQYLMKRGKSSEHWQLLATLNSNTNSYNDLVIKGESDYGYALVAVDSSGLKSELSFPLNITTPKLTPPVVKGLRIFANPDKSVSLYWDYPIDYCKYTIYKSLEDGRLISYDSVYDKKEFRDKRAEKGISKYAVRVIYQDGRQSKLSSTIEVNVK